MKPSITIMNFSGIYEKESFYLETDHSWLDMKHLSGTNCYCDDEAMDAIREKIVSLETKGIHFLDSGNYHYVSRIWMEKIHQPFQLLVFDNHTDLQPPAFGGLLSCGGWIADSLEKLPELKKVFLVGPDGEACSRTDREYQKKTIFLTREMLQEAREKQDLFSALEALGMDYRQPVYISVDKDILSTVEIKTNWSQGDMSFTELLDLLSQVLLCWKKEGGEILGVDICGEPQLQEAGTEENDRVNKDLMHLLEKLL